MMGPLTGATIGAMIKAAGMAAEVSISDDSIVVKFKTGETPVDAKESVKKTQKKRRRSRKDLVTCNGETHTIEEWAKKRESPKEYPDYALTVDSQEWVDKHICP